MVIRYFIVIFLLCFGCTPQVKSQIRQGLYMPENLLDSLLSEGYQMQSDFAKLIYAFPVLVVSKTRDDSDAMVTTAKTRSGYSYDTALLNDHNWHKVSAYTNGYVYDGEGRSKAHRLVQEFILVRNLGDTALKVLPVNATMLEVAETAGITYKFVTLDYPVYRGYKYYNYSMSSALMDSVLCVNLSGNYQLKGKKKKVYISPIGEIFGLDHFTEHDCDNILKLYTSTTMSGAGVQVDLDCRGTQKYYLKRNINQELVLSRYNSSSTRKKGEITLIRTGPYQYKQQWFRNEIERDFTTGFTPGLFYQQNRFPASDSLGNMVSSGFSFNLFNRIAQTNESGPSHYRMVLQFGETRFSKLNHPSLYFATGFDFSIERNPARNILIPVFGIKWEIIGGKEVANLIFLKPTIGLHVVSNRYLLLNLNAGYAYELKNIEKYSGFSLGANLSLSLW